MVPVGLLRSHGLSFEKRCRRWRSKHSSQLSVDGGRNPVPWGAIRQRFPLRLPGERPIGKDRISETPVLVNTLEKVAPAEFSIREFGSVSDLGSQTIFLQNANPWVLRAPIFQRRRLSRNISPILL